MWPHGIHGAVRTECGELKGHHAEAAAQGDEEHERARRRRKPDDRCRARRVQLRAQEGRPRGDAQMGRRAGGRAECGSGRAVSGREARGRRRGGHNVQHSMLQA
eukprot:5023203-Prymnesium_polylepis.1